MIYSTLVKKKGHCTLVDEVGTKKLMFRQYHRKQLVHLCSTAFIQAISKIPSIEKQFQTFKPEIICLLANNPRFSLTFYF